MDDTCHLYTDLAWPWPMWGDATTESALSARHRSDSAAREAPGKHLVGHWQSNNSLTLTRRAGCSGLLELPAS